MPDYKPNEALLQKLGKETGIENPNELLNKALSIMEWALKGENAGRTILSGATVNQKITAINSYIKVNRK